MLKSLKNQIKRAKKDAAALPRKMADISKDYADLAAKAGQTQYVIYVNKMELAKLNKRLEEVNYEAAARQELDAQEKARAESSQEKEVQDGK